MPRGMPETIEFGVTGSEGGGLLLKDGDDLEYRPPTIEYVYFFCCSYNNGCFD